MSEPVEAATGLRRAVEVMDRLRGPGGCPWDAEQTHRSLARYLLEEAYEAVDAIDSGDREHLREELGDVLLQVLFHSRIATEHQTAPWSVDDVADDLVAKLVRRHPHVFADVSVTGAGQVAVNWESIKATEKGRSAPYDGVVWSQPALALAAQVLRKAARAQLSPDLPPPADPSSVHPKSVDPDSVDPEPIDPGPVDPEPDDAERRIGYELLSLVQSANAEGVDAELALRRAVREFTDES